MAIGDPTATAAYREALDASEPSTQRPPSRPARPCRGDVRRPRHRRRRARRPRARRQRRRTARSCSLRATSPSTRPTSSGPGTSARRPGSASSPATRTGRSSTSSRCRACSRTTEASGSSGMRAELRRTRDAPEIANAVFDGYLCPAEYLLYGPTPYADVIEIAGELRSTARRSGALRAVAFATALAGEAALLSGDLPLAATELQEAVDLHHDLGSAAGEAHSLQRLAEVRLAEGDLAEANRLLEQALPLARWSMIAPHLLQRIYGTMIAAAPDPMSARAMVDRAESTFGVAEHCTFCSVMLAVPAADRLRRLRRPRPCPPATSRWPRVRPSYVGRHGVGGGGRRGQGPPGRRRGRARSGAGAAGRGRPPLRAGRSAARPRSLPQGRRTSAAARGDVGQGPVEDRRARDRSRRR